MGKIDPRRDYYADLELSRNADIVEIKKQFKKLALKYHPDRNPGHEDEFNAKFQAIQCAHEVLSDPLQKAQYDAERARVVYGLAGAVPRGTGPARNPYAAYSNFPPPPARAPTSAYTTRSSAGAHRYSNFAASYQASREKDEACKRTNAARAWEYLNKSANNARREPTATPYPPPPRAGATQPNGAAPGTSQRGPSSWRKAAEESLNNPKPEPSAASESQNARTARKTGFAPGAVGGDEPAASNYSYVHVNRGGHRHAHEVPVPPASSRRPPQPPPTPERPDPLKQFRQTVGSGAADSPRLSTPYATTGGERTYFSSSVLGRSATLREQPLKSPTTERHRSASPPRTRQTEPRNAFAPGSRTGPPSPTSRTAKNASSDTESPPQQRRGRRTGTRRAQFDHYVASDTSSDEQRESDRESPSFMERLATQGRARGRRPNPHRNYPYPVYTSPSGLASTGSGPRVSSPVRGGPPKDARPCRSKGEQNSRSDTQASSASNGNGVESGARKPHTFMFAVDDDMFVPTSPAASEVRNGSTKGINTRFSPADWHGEFTSKASDYFKPQPPTRTQAERSESRDVPGIDRTSGSQQKSSARDNNDKTRSAPPIRAPLDATRPKPISPDTFQPEYWTEEMKQQSWDVPLRSPASPIRPPGFLRMPSDSRSKTSKHSSTKRPVVPKPVAVTSSSDEADNQVPAARTPNGQGQKRHEEQPVNEILDDDNAMDIDPATPANEPVQEASGPSSGTVPTVQVESDFVPNGSTTIHPHQGDSKLGNAIPNSTKQVPPMASGLHSAPNGSLFDVSSLKTVEPLIQPSHGLKTMADLSSTLPFESRPSPAHPSMHASNTGEETQAVKPAILELPSPPKPPGQPTNLFQNTWEPYLAQMKAYMFEWTHFIDLMLAHFNGRQNEVKTGLAPNWMGNLGEGSQGGYKKYMQGLEADFRVRAHWDVAWDRHREAMRTFGEVRRAAVEKAFGGA